ncbi:ankyrin repeat domain-containing protein, partial [archaeon]
MLLIQPLHWFTRSLLLVMLLGTPLNIPDRQGDTPLHYAAKFGHLDLCRLLVDRGAMVHMQNKAKQSPYDIAESHHLVRQYLLPLVLQSERAHGVVQQDYTGYGAVHMP